MLVKCFVPRKNTRKQIFWPAFSVCSTQMLVKIYNNFCMFVLIIFTNRLLWLGQDIVVLGKNGRHSFGRAQDRIPAPTRAKNRTNWKRHKRRPVNDHKDVRAGARKGLDLKLVMREKDSIRRMWTKKEREKPRGEKDIEGGRNSMKHSKDELQHENKTGWSSASSNITQAAVHKERWREQITHKKKTLVIRPFP